MALAWLMPQGRWLRTAFGRSPASRCSRDVARLLRQSGERRRPASHGRVAGINEALAHINGQVISEADLHAYVDGNLGALDRIEVEAFLAAHPRIAKRVEAYRSQAIAVNAAFGAGDSPVPPRLARLGERYARALSWSTVVGVALGIGGLGAILCAMAGAALGASLTATY